MKAWWIRWTKGKWRITRDNCLVDEVDEGKLEDNKDYGVVDDQDEEVEDENEEKEDECEVFCI